MTACAKELADALDRMPPNGPAPDLATPALLIARIEYPPSIPIPTSIGWTAWATAPCSAIAADPGHDAPLPARIDALNRYLFERAGLRRQPRAATRTRATAA